MKNAIDYLFTEWNDKAAGFVGYGLHGGVRAVEHLRGALAEVKVACVRSQVALSLFTDFAIDDMTAPGTFTPAEHHTAQLQRTVDELVSWSAALRTVRTRGDGVSGSDEAPFTMLIEFEVPPPRQHEFADRLRTYIAQSLPAVDGFLSARVQASVDGGTVINYAQWTSRTAWGEGDRPVRHRDRQGHGPELGRESPRPVVRRGARPQPGRRAAHRGRRLDPERHGVRPLRAGGVGSRRAMINDARALPDRRALSFRARRSRRSRPR